MQWLSDLINLALFHEASRIVCWWWRNDTLDLVPMVAFDGCCCCFCYCNCIAFEPTDSILARFARITNGSSFSVVHTFSTRERSNNKFLRELAPRPSPSRRSSGTHMYTYIWTYIYKYYRSNVFLVSYVLFRKTTLVRNTHVLNVYTSLSRDVPISWGVRLICRYG